MFQGHILAAKINTYLGALLVLSCGIFILTIGFRIERMEDPIADMIAQQAGALSVQ